MMKNKILGYKKKYLLFTAIEWAFIIIPFLTLCLVKKDVYFKTKNDTISMTLGLVLGMVVVVLSAANKVPKNRGVFYYIAAVLLCWLFKSCLNDVLLIVSVSFVGYVVSIIFAIKASKNKKLFEQYKGALINEDVRKNNDGAMIDEKGNIK